MTTLRVLSYNLHKGFTFINRKFLLSEMRKNIRLVNADIVCLQEVVGENKQHSQKMDDWIPQQFEFLADDVWPHYAYGKNAIYDHGHHGNAILSQYPFIHYENVDVSRIPTSQRGILFGQTENGVYIACIHFGLLSFERKLQVDELCRYIKNQVPDDAPLIICGDFNDWRKNNHRIICEKLKVKEALAEVYDKPAATFPALFPIFPMDRIYFRNLILKDAAVLNGQPWNRLSDHCALYAEFSLV